MSAWGEPWLEYSIATWNVYHGTPAKDLSVTLEELASRGVVKVYMQEAGGSDITNVVQAAGFATAAFGEHRLAWNPHMLQHVRQTHLRLSPIPYFAEDGDVPKFSEALGVLLVDKWGRLHEDWVAHTPSHVQFPSAVGGRRLNIMLQSLDMLSSLAEESMADVWNCGLDLNWDVDTGLQNEDVFEALMRDPVLRLLKPSEPTLGGRQIDVFLKRRVSANDFAKDLRESAWTMDTRAAEKPRHQVHGRTFRFIA